MPKLTKSLARTLDALKPYEGDEAFMRKVNDGESPIDGTSARRLVVEMGELQTLGYIKVFQYAGKADSFDLTSQGRDYRRNRICDIARTASRYALQLLVGASGGLVVLLVGKALGQ